MKSAAQVVTTGRMVSEPTTCTEPVCSAEFSAPLLK